MTSIRKLFFIVAACALAAFALPAGAASKAISLTVASPAQPFDSSTTTVTLTLSNDGNSNGNSYEIDWIETPNFHVVSGTVGGVAGTPVNPGVWASSTGKAYQGLVWNKTAPAKTTVTITLTVTVTPGCPATTASLAAAMWTGSPGPLSTSFPLTGGPISAGIALGAGTCGSLSIDTRGSAILNTPFAVNVNLNGGPGGADVSLVSSNCTYSGGGTKNAGTGGYLVTYSGFTLTQNPANHVCTITATDPTGGYSPASQDIYIGTLDCNTADQTTAVFPPVAGTAGYFSQMPAGTTVTNPGFAAGYRFNNDKSDPCQLVNFTFTNNITGTSNTMDPNGNTIPPNAAGLVWDQSYQPNAVFVYMLTYKPEYVDPTTGLPKNKTRFCVLNSSGTTDCSDTSKQKILQACVGTAFSSSSIPGSDPACVMQESWTTVPASDCAGLTNPNGSNPPPACVRATDKILDARDPPIIRG